jgi:hypothetical protein
MIDKLQDIEKASDDVRNYFRSILEGRLLSIDVEKITDEELPSLIPNGFTDCNRGFRYADNLCSWYTISESEVWNIPKTHTKIYFRGENAKIPLRMNYSLFRYPLYFDREKYVIFAKRSGISTIDNKLIDPELFFTEHMGEKILYICGFNGVDVFGGEKICAYFAKENIKPFHLRRYILEAQITTLIEILHDPDGYSILPPVDIIRECDGGPYFFKDVKSHSLMKKIANRIFSEEFIDIYKSKYVYLLSRYANFCKQ